MGFPRQEYCSSLLFPSPGDLPDPGIKPASPTLQVDSLLLSHWGNPIMIIGSIYWNLNIFQVVWQALYIIPNCSNDSTNCFHANDPVCVSHSVVSNSLRPHEPQPARLPWTWNSPGKNTGMGYHLQDYKSLQDIIAILGRDELSEGKLTVSCALKIQLSLSQSFQVAEVFTCRMW